MDGGVPGVAVRIVDEKVILCVITAGSDGWESSESGLRTNWIRSN